MTASQRQYTNNVSNSNNYIKQQTAEFEALLTFFDVSCVQPRMYRNKPNKHTILRSKQRSCKYLYDSIDEDTEHTNGVI
jgi:hypothetical protein